MSKNKIIIAAALLGVTAISCKKEGCTDSTATNYNEEAKKDDGSCKFETKTPEPEELVIPANYEFKDGDGNSTVSYSGQEDRLKQLGELTKYAKTGNSAVLDVQILKDMFSNKDDNGGGNFTFSSTKQLENKCFANDVDMFKSYFDSVAIASVDFATTATNGQAEIGRAHV